MKVSRVQCFFDCRVYKKDTKRNQRPLSKNGDRINISIGCKEDDPNFNADFKEFARKHETSGLFYLSVKAFPNNLKTFNASAQSIAFPSNEILDGNSYILNMEYSVKHGTGTELNGIYANKIQFIKQVNNDFDAVEDGDDNVFGQKPAAPSPLSTRVSENIPQHEMFEGAKSAIENPPVRTPQPLAPSADDDLPF